MKVCFRIVLLVTLSLALAEGAGAQSSGGQSAGDLRAQLLDVESKQAELEQRARRIDEDLKPENIERSLALTGSTRPEELREQRRRQLEKEKESVRAQVDQLAASRTRLESAIAAADAESYRRGALVTPNTSTATMAAAAAGSAAPPANSVQQQRQQPGRRNARRRRQRRRRN